MTYSHSPSRGIVGSVKTHRRFPIGLHADLVPAKSSVVVRTTVHLPFQPDGLWVDERCGEHFSVVRLLANDQARDVPLWHSPQQAKLFAKPQPLETGILGIGDEVGLLVHNASDQDRPFCGALLGEDRYETWLDTDAVELTPCAGRGLHEVRLPIHLSAEVMGNHCSSAVSAHVPTAFRAEQMFIVGLVQDFMISAFSVGTWFQGVALTSCPAALFAHPNVIRLGVAQPNQTISMTVLTARSADGLCRREMFQADLWGPALVPLDFDMDQYLRDYRRGVAPATERALTARCACGHHAVDPSKDGYAQHRLWLDESRMLQGDRSARHCAGVVRHDPGSSGGPLR